MDEQYPPPSMRVLGYCPSCGCTSIDGVPPQEKAVCADCGYTEHRNKYYCITSTLYSVLQENK